MAESAKSTPGWAWIVGAVVVVVLVLGLFRLIDLIFSLPFLLLVIIIGGGYLWFRSSRKG
jgi:flagellar biosynthesis protein FliP